MRLGLTVGSYDGETVEVAGRLAGRVALHDVRATCRLAPRRQWEGLVLATLQGLALSAEADVDLGRYEAVGPLLRSRVLTEAAVLLDDVVAVPLSDGLVEVLVADVRGAVTPLPPQVVLGWQPTVADLFDRARQQTAAVLAPTVRGLDLDGVHLVAVESTSAFAATAVRRLGGYLEIPASGALVALPTRHLLLAAPLRSRADTLAAAQLLLVNAERLEREGPGGLSPDLWWWRPEALVRLPGSPSGLRPPIEFLDVLDALPG